MSLRKIYDLIPPFRRRRLPSIVLSSLCSAVIDLLGIAALVSVLLVVLDESVVSGNRFFAAIYAALGFGSVDGFIIAVCVTVLVVIALKGVAGLWLSQVRNRYMLCLYADLSTRMYENYLSRGLQFIRNNHTTRLINNVNAICHRFAFGIVSPLLGILTEAMVLLVLFAFLLFYNPLILLLAVAVFTPMTLVYSRLIRKRMAENGRMENKLQVGQNKTMYEALRGYADIEIGNAKPYVARRFRAGIENLRHYSLKALLMRGISGYLIEFSLVLGVVAVIVVGLLAGEQMSSLKLFLGVFAVAAYRIVPSISRIVGFWTEYKRSEFVVATLSDELSAVGGDDLSSSVEKLPFEKDITLSAASFGYEGGQNVIDNLSLRIAKGEKVGIQGASGTGKTTLFNILAGLFPTQEGTLAVDGTPVDTPLKRRMWQNNIAYVSQDLFIPDISIAENIAFGVERAGIDSARLMRAIETARLGELVASLPDGIDTVTGESGCRLSGGQRQRIGIARALYKEASVLMFDEATSSLDAQTEHEIVESIERLSLADDRLTILFISHNDNTLGFCDRIIRL